MTGQHESSTGERDELGMEGPFSEGLDNSEQAAATVASAEFEESPFAEAEDEWSAAEAGEGLDTEWQESSEAFPGEASEGFGADAATLESLLEAEAGTGTALAERLAGVAAFLAGPNLRRGNRGSGVATLQRSLVRLGAAIAVDGIFGPATDRAVRNFQRRSGLNVDGIAGPRTKAAIAAALGGRRPVPPQPSPPSPPPIPPSPASSTLSDAIVRVAQQEFRRWHPSAGPITERQDAAVPILQQYYRDGIGGAVPTKAQLQDVQWQNDHPWSAVFISWVMRTAGAGRTFPYAAAHRIYINATRLNRLNNNAASPFWAYRATEVPVMVGDLICNTRAGNGASYDNIGDGTPWKTHCDIVTEILPGGLRVIGGNVNQNVDTKPLVKTLPDGRLDLRGSQAKYFAVIRCRGAFGGHQPVPPAPIPPAPVPPAPGPSGNAGRLVVQRHPMIASHRGNAPDLILKWNGVQSGAVDVVLHFHGYFGGGGTMRLDRDKERLSGLDFTDPAAPGTPGRTRPTIAILPRGNFFGGDKGNAYNFPNLTGPGALKRLIDDALARVGVQTGTSLSMARFVLTGHSGGGSPVSRVLAHTDPDEVHVFDGLYGSAANVIQWANRRIMRELASPAGIPPALRIIYRPGEGTQAQSRRVATELHGVLNTAAAKRLRPFFRVEETTVLHDGIPPFFGWRLLANPGDSLPRTRAFTGGAFSNESESYEPSQLFEYRAGEGGESEAESLDNESEGFDNYDPASENETNESLAWLDVEAPGTEAEESHAEAYASEFYEPESGEDEESEGEWSESRLDEDYDAGEQEVEGNEAVDRDEAFESGEAEASGSELSALETLLEAETGVGTGLADRVIGIAQFVAGPNLRRGSKGAGVAALQRALVALGADIAVDGDFGSNTERAVRAFQARLGLAVDGIVGPQTKAAIAAELGGRVRPLPAPPVPPPGPLPIPPAPPPGGRKLTPRQFAAAYGPSARLSETRHRVPALVTLAQAAIESGWAERAPGFNFFGIKARPGDPPETRQLLRTKEVHSTPDRKYPEVISVTRRPDGRYNYVVRDWFHIFPDAAASFDGHGALLARSKHHTKAFAHTGDPYAFATEVARGGYATEPSYEQVLHAVMRTIERAGGP